MEQQISNFTQINASDINQSQYQNYLIDTKFLLMLQKKHKFDLASVGDKLCQFLIQNYFND